MKFYCTCPRRAEGTLFIEINNSALEGDKKQIKKLGYSSEKLIETAHKSILAPEL